MLVVLGVVLCDACSVRARSIICPAMSHEHLLVERDDAVALITINRPKVLNALNTATLDELGQRSTTSGPTRLCAG